MAAVMAVVVVMVVAVAVAVVVVVVVVAHSGRREAEPVPVPFATLPALEEPSITGRDPERGSSCAKGHLFE